MLRKKSFRKRRATLVLMVFGVLLGAAWAQTESVLYSFCAQNSCIDGANPLAGLVFDQEGNLYGTTNKGGAYNDGAVFKLTPKGKETVLYSFCAQNNCTDGAFPYAGLVFDQEGNLYGTTFGGGAYENGTVFKLTPEGSETVLYSFCAQKGCTDGTGPEATLVLGKGGNLYGTTQAGGAYKYGVVFKLTPKGKEIVLYSFCAQNGCTDGDEPSSGLVFDKERNLYGTTMIGGAYTNCNVYSDGCGTVFKLTPKGSETVLYSFCAQIGCADGRYPQAGLVFDKRRNLYGTAYEGGNSSCDDNNGCGVVFKLTPEGRQAVLHTFCVQKGCPDGEYPEAGLVFDQKGNLYGTTYYGGAYGAGVVFKLTPKGKEIVLYSFCAQNGCPDGANPLAGLVLDQQGNLYGTTYYGGAYKDSGVVFKLTP
jgi:uncharacterized repeat protein (TIGR03803 family)